MTVTEVTAAVAGPILQMTVPPNLVPLWNAGKLVLKGSVLAYKNSGQVAGHLQETVQFARSLNSVSSMGGMAMSAANPVALGLNIFGTVGGIVQNEQIKNRLDLVQQAMQQMQILQIADLVGTVVGIGVTVASTAIILKRMQGLQSGLKTIEGKIDALPAEFRAQELHKVLDKVMTSLERLEAAGDRRDAVQVVRRAEEDLHECFNALHNGAMQTTVSPQASPELLAALLNGMALAGVAQVKSLFWLEEPLAAQKHAAMQCRRMQTLSAELPRDLLMTKFGGNAEAAVQVSAIVSQTRYRLASQPNLAAELVHQGVNSRAYLEAAEVETEAPLLFFPAAT